MRITLANEHSARAVGVALERYGYKVERDGSVLHTNCPVLLAIGIAERIVGLGRVGQVELVERRADPPPDASERAAV